MLTFYDKLATIYAGHHVSYARASFASFCAYALAHNLGFAAVSGAAVRYRLYAHWGLTPVQIGKVVAFCSLTFGLGGMTLGGIILFTEPAAVPVLGACCRSGRCTWPARPCGLWWGSTVVLASLFPALRVRGHTIELPGWRMALAQVSLATADVALTAAIFYVLLPHAAGLTWVRFLAVYLGSYAAGLVANVPGGLGVFDTAMLLGLEDTHSARAGDPGRDRRVPSVLLRGAAVRRRRDVRRQRGAGARRRKLSGAASDVPGQPRWSEPDFAVAASTGGVAICGAMLLSIGRAGHRTRITPGSIPTSPPSPPAPASTCPR